MGTRVLAISDVIVQILYNSHIRERFADVDLIISCGDLPNYYLEYIVSMLDVPLYYVRGNHDFKGEFISSVKTTHFLGGVDLHKKIVNNHGLIIGGIEGSLRYRSGPCMYTQSEMWMFVFSLIPRLIFNRIVFGRYLDIFVTHAPPWGIGDQSDLAHQGIKAFNWLIYQFKPTYHIHGHVHLYNNIYNPQLSETQTRVINVYGYKEIVIE